MNFLKLLILPFLVVSFSYGSGNYGNDHAETVKVLVDVDSDANESQTYDTDDYNDYQDYKFSVGKDGLLHITYKGTDDSRHDWMIGTSKGDNDIYDEGNNKKKDFNVFEVQADKDYYLRIKRDNDLKYTIEWDYVAATDVEEADGICGGTEESDGSTKIGPCEMTTIGGESYKKIQLVNATDGNINTIRVEYTDNSIGINSETGCKTEPRPYSDDSNTTHDCLSTGKKAFFNFRTHSMTPDDDDVFILIETGMGGKCSSGDDITITYKDENGNAYAGAVETCVEPKFCYDYAYEQNGRYFTEDNNGTERPRLVGKVDDKKDIGVKFYITNSDPEANMVARDMNISILDINKTQAYYEYNTTMKTLPKSIIQEELVDGTDEEDEAYIDENDDNVSIRNISIGTVDPTDRFYAHFRLDELNTSEADENTTGDDINISLNIRISYKVSNKSFDLTVGTDEIDICQNGGASYLPKPGLFNVVHKPIYEADTKYNIPTQVSSRVGNMELLSLKEGEDDELEAKTTIVAVEIIDVSAFHYTEATCQEQDSSINSDKKVWIVFDNDDKSDFDKTALDQAIIDHMTSLNKSSEFYEDIRRGVAYRVSYNTPNEDNADYITLDKNGDGDYNITNISGLDDNDNNCLINYKTDKVKDRCDDGFMDKDKLTQCMQCIYGGVENGDSKTGTSFVCSRDNFSIRPEAFKITLKDQNQINGADITIISSNEGNLTHPNTSTQNIAADYTYKMEVNATNFLNSNAVNGYTSLYKETQIEFIWYPDADRNVSGCNDDSNHSTLTTFIDGQIDQNSSIEQVGKYRVTYLDTNWTSSDWNETEMEHHEGDYFYDKSVPDCTEDSTIVYDEDDSDEDHKNGCHISSIHNNTENNSSFRDYNVTVHPYKFYKKYSDINVSIGLEHNQTIDDNNMSFVYMSDMSVDSDENMSFHLNGFIRASGYGDANLTNFVKECYATDLEIDINTSVRVHPLESFQYRFKTYENNGTLIYDSNATDFNTTHIDTILISEGNFSKESNGSIRTVLNLNYDRSKGQPINAMSVRYHNYIIDCTNANDCNFDANLDKNISAKHQARDINKTIKHYYGRTHVSRQRYEGAEGTSNLYYEVYCFDNPTGNDCNKSMLQSGEDSNRSSDIRWYINANHTAQDGVLGIATEKDNMNSVKDLNATGIHPLSKINLKYDGTKGFPYKTTMENNASGWLIYNSKDIISTKNKFSVEFESNSTNPWSGAHETNTTTIDNNILKTNRRSMW